MEKLITVNELAVLVGCSPNTIDQWYRWKKLHPEHELTKLLPDYKQLGERQLRLWKTSDAWSLIEFKTKIPKGRNGILGDATQGYARKKRREKHEQKLVKN